ncbi:group III truncated hemoglobin (plasmid) [Streptomyces sp. AHU1]|uniref:group III truncated hemoglobin n=1 Tax=Streptomyces sp. AHU1 TaxID=3377215 RepID=UPI003877A158
MMEDDGRPGPVGERADIQDRKDIEELVRAFYHEVLQDPFIGPLFTEVAHIDMASHLPVMADFWESALLMPGIYRRNALRAHRDLHAKSPLSSDHFARWLQLWTTTVRSLYTGPVADRAIVKANAVAQALFRNTTGEGRLRPAQEVLVIGRGPDRHDV